MKLDKILTAVKALPSKAIFQVKAHSPEILVVGGVAAIITGTVLACKQTPKALEAIKQNKKDIQKIDDVSANPEDYTNVDYHPEEDEVQDKMICYIQTGVKLVKVYAVPAVCILAGIAMLLGSNHILKCRWLASAGAYEALNESIKAYRKRVSEEVGEEKEKELYINSTPIDIQKESEDGMPSVEKRNTVDPAHLGSPYAVIFDEFNPNWKRDPSYNRIFLQCQQNYANDLLHARGHLYLSEVYDLLGYKYEPVSGRCDISAKAAKAARHLGWIDNEQKTKQIDFGMFDAFNKRAKNFIDGDEPSIVLDFNVDGDIDAKLFADYNTKVGKKIKSAV